MNIHFYKTRENIPNCDRNRDFCNAEILTVRGALDKEKSQLYIVMDSLLKFLENIEKRSIRKLNHMKLLRIGMST